MGDMANESNNSGVGKTRGVEKRNGAALQLLKKSPLLGISYRQMTKHEVLNEPESSAAVNPSGTGIDLLINISSSAANQTNPLIIWRIC
jgi:hypothetical protein